MGGGTRSLVLCLFLLCFTFDSTAVVERKPEFGFTTHFFVFTPESQLDLTKFYRSLDELQGKVDWIRVRMTTWELIHWEQPDPARDMRWLDENVVQYQEALREASRRGFKIYAYAEMDERLSNERKDLSEADRESFFRQWIKGLAQRFPQVNAWQILNEPNWTHFMTFKPMYVPGKWDVPELPPSYLRQVRRYIDIAREEIKKQHPQALITTNNGGWIKKDSFFKKDRARDLLYRFFDEVRPALDFISLDIYLNNSDEFERLPEQLRDFRNRYGEVWVAETGFTTCQKLSRESEQKNNIENTVRAMLKGGVNKIILFQYQDYDLEKDPCAAGFGIKDIQNRRKQSYDAVLQLLQRTYP